ncbi:MAG: HD domain-containing protein [Candidatus Aenigmarchaeota archaeon]|nr:HD domain-containing protein [Candidatus Aenigmarchaeota archaeon]
MILIKVKIIKDAVHGDIECSELEIKLIDSPQFQRLRNIRQLGLEDLVYPSATHTRYEHCLGTMHISGKISHALNLEQEDINLIRISGLLHDIGHLPFSHTLEKVLSNGIGHLHEKNAAGIIENDLSDILEEYGIDADTVKAMILGNGKYGKVLSSGVDVDKMDYLIRDSYFTGVAYGVIDLSRLMHISAIRDGIFAFQEKGLRTIESVILARFMMFSAVYDYPTKRSAERMLFRALDAMDRRSLNITKLLKIDEVDFKSILRQQDGYTKDIIDMMDKRQIFKTSCIIKKNDLSQEHVSRCLEIKDNSAQHKRIENSMARELGIPEGYLIIDIMNYPKGIENIKILRYDETITNLKEISPLSRSLMRQRWQDWKVSFLCPKEYKEKTKERCKELFLKHLN